MLGFSLVFPQCGKVSNQNHALWGSLQLLHALFSEMRPKHLLHNVRFFYIIWSTPQCRFRTATDSFSGLPYNVSFWSTPQCRFRTAADSFSGLPYNVGFWSTPQCRFRTAADSFSGLPYNVGFLVYPTM